MARTCMIPANSSHLYICRMVFIEKFFRKFMKGLPYLAVGACGGVLLWLYRHYWVLPDTSDAIGHFLSARFAFRFPELLFDTWSKPLFTAVMLGPAQLGFGWVLLTNIAIWLATTYLAINSLPKGRLLRLAFPILTAAAPMYLHTVHAGLTEPLFAMLVMGVVYTAVHRHFLTLALVAGLLPLARPEAVVFWPTALVFLAMQRKSSMVLISCMPLFLVSIAGAFYHGTLFWFFTRQTYVGASDIYGSGSFFHFFRSVDEILGYPVLTMISIGILLGGYYFLIQRTKPAYSQQVQVLLVLLPVVATWLLHSWLWWQGSRGSLGLIRVMATTIPALVWLALTGWGAAIRYHKQPILLQFFLGLMLFGTLGRAAQLHYDNRDYFRKPHPHNIQPGQVAGWLPSIRNEGRLFFLHPLLGYYLDVHPLDTAHTKSIWDLHLDQPDLGTRVGDWVIWDAQHSPNEGRLPLDRLFNNDHFVLRGYFPPREAWVALNEYPYEYFVFERRDGYAQAWRDTSYSISDTILGSEQYPMIATHFLYPEDEHVIYSQFRIAGEIQTSGVVYPVFQLDRFQEMHLYRIAEVESGDNGWGSFEIEVVVPQFWFGDVSMLYVWNPHEAMGEVRNIQVYRKDFIQRRKIDSNLQVD
jgi:hypothetical protein